MSANRRGSVVVRASALQLVNLVSVLLFSHSNGVH